MQGRVEFAPVIYDTFAGRLGKYVGDYGRNFVKLEFPDKTVRAFPRQDVTFLDQSAATTSETDRIRRALASDELLVWGQIKRFEPYGKQYYLKKAYLGGFYGLNFVRLAGNLFPVGDVEIEIVERNEDFDYRQVTKQDLGQSFKEFRVLQYFQDWSEYGLIIDHVEWLYKTRVPMDQRQILVDRMLKPQNRDDLSIWAYTVLQDYRFAEATNDALNLNLPVVSADIRSNMVVDIAKKGGEIDEYVKLYTNHLTGLKRVYTDYLKNRKKMPFSQRVALSIEVFIEIGYNGGEEFSEAIRQKANEGDNVLVLADKQELFPSGDDLVPAWRVKRMKNDPGRKADIKEHRALDSLYDKLIKHYTNLLDIWEAARNDFNGIPDVETSFKDEESFSYIYIINLCRDIEKGLLAFEIEYPSVDLDILRDAFKDAKGKQRHAQRAKGITGNPKKRVEGTP